MRAELITLTDEPQNFGNIITARGPGTGINRPQVTVRNTASINAVGERELVLDFPSAVDDADLLSKATAALAKASDLANHQAIRITVTGSDTPDFRVGQQVRFSDSLLNTTIVTTVQRTEWTPTGWTLDLGAPPVNLLDVLTEEDEDERNQLALGLPPPIGLRVQGIPAGIQVLVNPFTQSRAVGVEIHLGHSALFPADRSTLAARGSGTRFQLSNLTPNQRVWVKTRAFDAVGNLSEWSEEVSAVPRPVDAAILDPDLAADIAYSKVQAAVVEAGAQTWSDISQLVTDQQALWDAGGKQTDGLVLTGTISARTSTTVTTVGRDWAAEGIQKGDQLRFPSTTPLHGRVFTVESVADATLTVTPAMSPLPDLGTVFQVGRVARITALGISQTDTELRTQVGSIEDDLDGDAFTSSYSAVRQSAELAQSGLTRQESTLMLTGETTDAGADTVTDVNHNFTNAGILKGDVVYVSDGPHAGLSRPIESVSGSVITLAEPFPVTIPTGTEYRVGRVNAVYGSAVTQTADEWRSVVGTLNEDVDYVGQYSSIQQLKDRILQVVGDVDALEGLVDALDATGSLEPMTTVNGISMTTVGGVDMTTSVERGLTAVFTAIAMNQHQIDTVASQTSTHYSLIQQNADQISQRVRNSVFTSTISQLSNEIDLRVRNSVFTSTISQLSNEIDLRVTNSQMTSAINVAIDGVTVTGAQININGNTNVSGTLRMMGGGSGNNANFEWWGGPANNPANRKLIIGAIPTGFGGAPANQIGIAIEEGAFYARGVPRALFACRINFTGTLTGSLTANTDHSVLYTYTTPQMRLESITGDTLGPFTIPDGKRWLLVPLTGIWTPYVGTLERGRTIWLGGRSGNNAHYSTYGGLTAGTYDYLFAGIFWRLRTYQAVPSGAPITIRQGFIMMEVDA